MVITIAEDISRKIGLGEEELLLELAILLFEQERLTLGQASRLAKMHQSQFQKVLAEREISIHYGEIELLRDVETAREINL
ncbi:MAG: UPF0175 family protein [Tunicatimonas sp.]|uniref:UPF0175 family protein n=1 Tax=Tunicatimonas sp. TaxID=1940096 RepID=UPI003C739C2F